MAAAVVAVMFLTPLALIAPVLIRRRLTVGSWPVQRRLAQLAAAFGVLLKHVPTYLGVSIKHLPRQMPPMGIQEEIPVVAEVKENMFVSNCYIYVSASQSYR